MNQEIELVHELRKHVNNKDKFISLVEDYLESQECFEEYIEEICNLTQEELLEENKRILEKYKKIRAEKR